jgi:hypothetical protein
MQDRQQASCLSNFLDAWGNQVGKAAIDGWQNVIRPALALGGRLWPFEGALHELSKSTRCVFCETYSREAMATSELPFGKATANESRTIGNFRRNPSFRGAKSGA